MGLPQRQPRRPSRDSRRRRERVLARHHENRQRTLRQLHARKNVPSRPQSANVSRRGPLHLPRLREATMAKSKAPTQVYDRTSRGEIQPTDRQTPTVRLDNTLKPPKRKPLGNPYK